MKSHRLLSTLTMFLGAGLLVLALTNATLAGGFAILVQSVPPGSANPNDVLLVRTFGCQNPADATITGTLEGLVNGQRQTRPLQLMKTKEPGVYLVKKQWSEPGVWLISLTATYAHINRGAIVEIGADGRIRPAKKDKIAHYYETKVSSATIDSTLRQMAAGEQARN